MHLVRRRVVAGVAAIGALLAVIAIAIVVSGLLSPPPPPPPPPKAELEPDDSEGRKRRLSEIIGQLQKDLAEQEARGGKR